VSSGADSFANRRSPPSCVDPAWLERVRGAKKGTPDTSRAKTLSTTLHDGTEIQLQAAPKSSRRSRIFGAVMHGTPTEDRTQRTESQARGIQGQRCGCTWQPPEEFPSAGREKSAGFFGKNRGKFRTSPSHFYSKSGTKFRGGALSVSRFRKVQFPVSPTFNFRFRSLSISGFAHFQYPVLLIFNIRFCQFAISGFAHLQYPVLSICNIRFCHFSISGFAIFQY
jgi:hypothetical protein